MSDLDIWEQAFKTMNLNENILFVSRGKLITEASQVEMFNKINALLNADGMECSHKWLYALDPTELTEAEVTKVNNLYKLGCDRGIIECGKTEEDKDVTDEAEIAIAADQTAPVVATAPEQTEISVPLSAYTVLYSAMRNGEIKTGEAYSNAINPRSAKADIISQLERAGYNSIKVLAIECGDPDECGNNCSNTFCKLAETTPIAVTEPTADDIPDYSVDVDDTDESVNEDGEKDAKDSAKDDDGKKDDEKEDSSDDENDGANADDKKDKKADKKEEKAEEPDEKLKDDVDDKAKDASDKAEDKELDATEKATLKDAYKKAFKAAMLKCKFEDMSFDLLSLEQKVDFFTELSKAWGTKADPTKFMTDKEVELLESIVVKK